MILVVTLVVIAVAFGVRVLLHRYDRISAATAAPVALVVAFAFGYTVAPHANRLDQGTSGTAVPGSVTLASSAPGSAGAPPAVAAAPGKHDVLSPSDLRALHVLPGITSGFVDGFLIGSDTTLEKEPTIARTAKIRISGWIVTPSKQPATAVILIIDGKTRVEVTPGYGGHRPDVATFLGNPDAVDVGIDAPIPLTDLKAGSHTVEIGAVGDDRRSTGVLRASTFDVR